MRVNTDPADPLGEHPPPVPEAWIWRGPIPVPKQSFEDQLNEAIAWPPRAAPRPPAPARAYTR